MAQKSIEIILLRQLACYLNLPIIIIDADGDFIFCNESAEKILSLRFSETGEMSADEWATLFSPQDNEGQMLTKEKSPIHIAQSQHCIAYNTFFIRNLQNEIKHIELFAFPIINQMNTFLGMVACFQEVT